MAVEFSDNADGSVIVKLPYAVKVGGEETDRATIPAMRGRHVRACPFVGSDGSDIPYGKIVAFANDVVLPVGIVDEMDPADALAVGVRVANELGKSRATGAKP